MLDHPNISIMHGKNMNTVSDWRWLSLLVQLLKMDLSWYWQLGANCLTIITPYHIILEEYSTTIESQSLTLPPCISSVAVLVYPLLFCFSLQVFSSFLASKTFWWWIVLRNLCHSAECFCCALKIFNSYSVIQEWTALQILIT